MIETNDRGQKQLEDLRRNTYYMNDWEVDFMKSVCGHEYKDLSLKQQTTVSNMWEKHCKS